VGAGINYTKFTDIESKLPGEVQMSDSTGLALQLGFDYAIDRNWGFFASIARVDVKSKLVAVGSSVLETTIDFKPITYSIGASYRF
jgi:outer membrane protein